MSAFVSFRLAQNPLQKCLQGKHCFFFEAIHGALGSMVNFNITKISIKTARVSRLFLSCDYGLKDTFVRDLQTSVFTDLPDVVFTTLQVREGSRDSNTRLTDFLKKEFQSSRVPLLICLWGKLGLTCLLVTLITDLPANLDFSSSLGPLETGLQPTLDFRDLLGTSN